MMALVDRPEILRHEAVPRNAIVPGRSLARNAIGSYLSAVS
jgi:hypothetical protein